MNEKLFYFVLSLAMITNAVWIIDKIHLANQLEKETLILLQKNNEEFDKIVDLMNSIQTRIETLENK